MEQNILTETVSPEDLKKFERIYHEQLARGTITTKTQFEYAWCLVRSRYPTDIIKGTILLDDLVHNGDVAAKRDYLYFLAAGNAKLKEYNKALSYIRILLSAEPANIQARELEKIIKKSMEREGLIGMGIIGGAVLAVGGLIGLGIALAKK